MASATAPLYLFLEGLRGKSKHAMHVGEFELDMLSFDTGGRTTVHHRPADYNNLVMSMHIGTDVKDIYAAYILGKRPKTVRLSMYAEGKLYAVLDLVKPFITDFKSTTDSEGGKGTPVPISQFKLLSEEFNLTTFDTDALEASK